ncbi:BLUF domain-containing protein [Skermanella aerolata]|uniref:BLUF domain-containing protein n=1 Tax=Skermanella aerolata TaxID=393310 RepID=UPI0005CA996C|nr:BLUF domain-containing protein [Skermanella aerolata]KJB91417.1 hypothetical protein N826_30700 [Skermanella aerolata KACC 11604]
MISPVYVSSATRHFSHGELMGLLDVSRRNNGAAGTAGLLLHSAGNFGIMVLLPKATSFAC